MVKARFDLVQCRAKETGNAARVLPRNNENTTIVMTTLPELTIPYSCQPESETAVSDRWFLTHAVTLILQRILYITLHFLFLIIGQNTNVNIIIIGVRGHTSPPRYVPVSLSHIWQLVALSLLSCLSLLSAYHGAHLRREGGPVFFFSIALLGLTTVIQWCYQEVEQWNPLPLGMNSQGVWSID